MAWRRCWSGISWRGVENAWVWDYIKNSGRFPEAETLTLEWVGHIPGKRESRRFEGPYLLRQQDVVGQAPFDDVVAHGGWSLDLHPVDGVYSERPPCNQWHAKSPCPAFSFEIDSAQSGALRVELCRAEKPGNFTPDVLLEALEIPFVEGRSRIAAQFRTPRNPSPPAPWS